MAKTTIVAAMFTLCERETVGVVVAGGERWWRQRRGKTVGLEKREKEEGMNRRPPSITRASVGWLLRPHEQMIKEWRTHSHFVTMLKVDEKSSAKMKARIKFAIFFLGQSTNDKNIQIHSALSLAQKNPFRPPRDRSSSWSQTFPKEYIYNCQKSVLKVPRGKLPLPRRVKHKNLDNIVLSLLFPLAYLPDLL